MSTIGGDMRPDERRENVADAVRDAFREFAPHDEAALERVRLDLAHGPGASAGSTSEGWSSRGSRRWKRVQMAVLCLATAAAIGALLLIDLPWERSALPARAEIAARAKAALGAVPTSGTVLYQEVRVEVRAGKMRGTEEIRVWESWDGALLRVDRETERYGTGRKGRDTDILGMASRDQSSTTVLIESPSAALPRDRIARGVKVVRRGDMRTATSVRSASPFLYHPYLGTDCAGCHSISYFRADMDPTEIAERNLASDSIEPSAALDVRRSYVLSLLNDRQLRFLGKRVVDGQDAYAFEQSSGAVRASAYVSAVDYAILKFESYNSRQKVYLSVRFRDRRVIADRDLPADLFALPRR